MNPRKCLYYDGGHENAKAMGATNAARLIFPNIIVGALLNDWPSKPEKVDGLFAAYNEHGEMCPYWYGQMAQDKQSSFTTPKGATRYTTSHYALGLLISLANIFPGGGQFDIYVTHPTADTVYRPELARCVKGDNEIAEWTIQLPEWSKPAKYVIHKITMYEEPYAQMRGFQLKENGESRVTSKSLVNAMLIDIGGYTAQVGAITTDPISRKVSVTTYSDLSQNLRDRGGQYLIQTVDGAIRSDHSKSLINAGSGKFRVDTLANAICTGELPFGGGKPLDVSASVSHVMTGYVSEFINIYNKRGGLVNFNSGIYLGGGAGFMAEPHFNRICKDIEDKGLIAPSITLISSAGKDSLSAVERQLYWNVISLRAIHLAKEAKVALETA